MVLVASWCALAAGLLEGLHHVVWRYGVGKLVFLGADVYWMAPLSYLLLFAGPALALAALASLWPRWVPTWFTAGCFAALGSFGVLSLYVHGLVAVWAIGLLALGIGAQAARLTRARTAGMLGFMRRSGVVMAGVVVLVMGWALAGRSLRERVGLASLAAAPSGAVNVLFIILDTVRSENLGLYGYPRPTTPNLERLAREGVTFDEAFSAAPWTLPSHASLFTGRWPHELTADWQRPLDRSWPTLAESFSARGYRTAGFVANLYYTGRDAGLDRGFQHYEEHLRTRRQLLLSSYLGQALESWRTHWTPYHPFSDRKPGSEVSREFLAWLDRGGERPFFAFLNYFDAHLPHYAPAEFRQRFRSGKGSIDSYDASIAYLDQVLGSLFDDLAARRVLDNTVVVVASDHGELFGEHGLTQHGVSLYEPELHVPLVIRFPPRVPAGIRIAEYVSLRNLPATIVALTGGGSEFPGASFAPLWSAGDGSWSQHGPVLSEVSRGIRAKPTEPVSRGPMKSLIAEPYHYIRNGDGREELYDLRQDRGELTNLATTRHQLVPRLGRLLDSYLGRRTETRDGPDR